MPNAYYSRLGTRLRTCQLISGLLISLKEEMAHYLVQNTSTLF